MSTAAPPVPALHCRFCGRAPAVNATVRAHRGMIILMQWRYLRGPFCRDCGLQAVHRMTTQTLWQGWWGIFSLFFGAPFALIANFLVSRRFKALPEPAGQPVHVAPPQPGGAYPPPGSTPPPPPPGYAPPPPDPTA